MSYQQICVAVLASGTFAACSQESPAFDPRDYGLVDLTHEYSDETVYWPTEEFGFTKTTLSEGADEAGNFYAAFAVATAEHGGTHMDAPYHFDADGDRAEAVPLERLMAYAAVIDVSRQAAADPLYRLTPEDVVAFEAEHGRIPAGAIVLLNTGWSRYWPDGAAYLGGTEPDSLAFPSFGAEAATLLVEDRRVAALGVDTASTDYGPSADFPVHRIMGAANVPGFENLTNLDRLPAMGAVVIALPMKIAGGSGGPLRAVALLPPER